MAKLVSQVYAEALFGLGVENGLLDTLLEELNGMCEILGENPQFVTLLGHPELDQKEKTAVFDRVFDGKISKELNGFCHLLLEKGRFGELFAIREDYERRCLAYHKKTYFQPMVLDSNYPDFSRNWNYYLDTFFFYSNQNKKRSTAVVGFCRKENDYLECGSRHSGSLSFSRYKISDKYFGRPIFF